MNEDLNTSPPKTNDYELNKEVGTGKTWIDGKSIYRFVAKGKTPAKSQFSRLYDATSLNVSELVKAYGVVKGTHNFTNASGHDGLRLGYNFDDKYFWLRNVGDEYANEVNVTCIFEYTKV